MSILIEAVSPPKIQEKAQKPDELSAVPVISLRPLGPKIIDFEASGTRFSKETVQKAKVYYNNLHSAALGAIRSQGLPPKPKSKEEAVAAFAVISKVLWDNVRYAAVDLVLEGLSRHPPVLDCDTSAFFTADVFRSMGLKAGIISIAEPNHAVLGVELANREKVFIETTSGAGGNAVICYPSKSGLDKEYGGPGNMREYAYDANSPKLYSMLHFYRGSAKDRLGDPKGAIADYTESIRLNPKDARAFNNRGSMKYAQGDYKGAAADYTESTRLNPKLAAAFNNLGNVKYAQGDYKGAAADYTESTRLNPKLAQAFRGRGLAKDRLGDLKGAIADYTESIRLDPNNKLAYENRSAAERIIREQGGRKNSLEKS